MLLSGGEGAFSGGKLDLGAFVYELRPWYLTGCSKLVYTYTMLLCEVKQILDFVTIAGSILCLSLDYSYLYNIFIHIHLYSSETLIAMNNDNKFKQQKKNIFKNYVALVP